VYKRQRPPPPRRAVEPGRTLERRNDADYHANASGLAVALLAGAMVIAILRLLGWILSGAISGAILIIAVTALLGVGWLAVAVPVMAIVGVITTGVTVWRRMVRRA
jgi:hypothetical protein